MALLDRVIQMQQQGMQNSEIYKKLTEEGISPKEIDEALNQANVKTAVSQDPSLQPETIPKQSQEITSQTMPVGEPTQEMQQSIMEPNQQEQALQPPEQVSQPQYYPETPQAYPEEAYYPEQPALSTDTITEIAEQVVMEKLQEYEQKINNLVSFKNQIDEEVKDINERLKRVENSVEKLQQVLIGKIAEFDENASYIRKDLKNLHNTVSKLMNPLIDNYKELKKILKEK